MWLLATLPLPGPGPRRSRPKMIVLKNTVNTKPPTPVGMWEVILGITMTCCCKHRSSPSLSSWGIKTWSEQVGSLAVKPDQTYFAALAPTCLVSKVDNGPQRSDVSPRVPPTQTMVAEKQQTVPFRKTMDVTNNTSVITIFDSICNFAQTHDSGLTPTVNKTKGLICSGQHV